MNRLGVFLFYDEDGVVDDYICYLLDDINILFERLVIVCNGVLSPEGRNNLEKYTREIYVRKNEGFDFRAWRDTLIDYIGFNRVKEYDQLVLFNDSFFGPFTSFKKIFDEMETRKLDFWGLTVHGEVESVKKMCPYGYRPRYIQTYFLVINRRLLIDPAFFNYWLSIPIYKEFQQVSEKISAVFTKYFEDLGYTWGVYSDTTDLEEGREKNICHHAFNIYHLITERHYPIIKRKSFVLGKSRYLQNNHGLDLERAVNYIDKHTDYNMQLIYDHIVRRYNICEIKESINLEYIGEEVHVDYMITEKKICILAFLFDGDAKYFVYHLEMVPKDINIVVFAGKEEIYLLLKKRLNEMRHIEIRKAYEFQNYVQVLFAEIPQFYDSFDYFGIIHQVNHNDKLQFTVTNSLQEQSWDNLLGNIIKVCEILNKNEHIGMVVPAKPWFGNYIEEGNINRKEDLECIRNWSNLLGEDFKIIKDKYILGGYGGGWIKKQVLVNLINPIEYTLDLEKISLEMERCFDLIMPYIAQNQGYLTATFSIDRYAASELESHRYMTAKSCNIFGNILGHSEVSYAHLCRETNKVIKNYINLSKKEPVKVIKEVPVYNEIGLKRALINYLKKNFKIGRKK